MRVNVDKVLEWDQKLLELDDCVDVFQVGVFQFEISVVKFKCKYWWKNFKMMIILGVICVIIFIIIIGEQVGNGWGFFFWRGFFSGFWVLKVINLVFIFQLKIYIVVNGNFDLFRVKNFDVIQFVFCLVFGSFVNIQKQKSWCIY